MAQQELFPEAPAFLLPRTIWLVLVETDNAEPEVIPFYVKEDALVYARKEARDYVGEYWGRVVEREEHQLTETTTRFGYCYLVDDGDGLRVAVKSETIR